LPVGPIHANRPVGAPVRSNIFRRFAAVQGLAAPQGSTANRTANCTTASRGGTAISGGNFGAGSCCCCCC
jgi:hypothetical protein